MHLSAISGAFYKHRKRCIMANLATYSKAERDEIDRQLAQMTDKELDQLDSDGSKLLYQAKDKDAYRERQREYMRKYRQRIALASKLGIIKAGDDE